MSTIAAADMFGLPVSTTHVLSSGVAGTMAAKHSGLQLARWRNLVAARVVLSLPKRRVLLGRALLDSSAATSSWRPPAHGQQFRAAACSDATCETMSAAESRQPPGGEQHRTARPACAVRVAQLCSSAAPPAQSTRVETLAMSLGVAVLIRSERAGAGRRWANRGTELHRSPRPPPYRTLDERESAQVARVPPFSIPNGPRPVPPIAPAGSDLGPLFNANSCGVCHTDLACRRARGAPDTRGTGESSTRRRRRRREPHRVIRSTGRHQYVRPAREYRPRAWSVSATPEIEGHYYPDGMRWRMRVPHYDLGLQTRPAGSHSADSSPRLAPVLLWPGTARSGSRSRDHRGRVRRPGGRRQAEGQLADARQGHGCWGASAGRPSQYRWAIKRPRRSRGKWADLSRARER